MTKIALQSCNSKGKMRNFKTSTGEGWGRFSCRNGQTEESVAKAIWKATSQAASVSFSCNGPASGAHITGGEQKGQAPVPEAPSYAGFRVSPRS